MDSLLDVSLAWALDIGSCMVSLTLLTLLLCFQSDMKSLKFHAFNGAAAWIGGSKSVSELSQESSLCQNARIVGPVYAAADYQKDVIFLWSQNSNQHGRDHVEAIISKPKSNSAAAAGLYLGSPPSKCNWLLLLLRPQAQSGYNCHGRRAQKQCELQSTNLS